jgi:hypothetical protein
LLTGVRSLHPLAIRAEQAPPRKSVPSSQADAFASTVTTGFAHRL